MSENIKITIVIDNEKQNMENRGNVENRIVVTHDLSKTLMSTLMQNNLMEGSFCGERGECGRCTVQFIQGAPLPTSLERSRLKAEELRQGFRLSCLTRPKDDCVIRLEPPRETEISIVTEMMDSSENIDSISQREKLSGFRKMDVTKLQQADGRMEKSYIVAVDLGTTTIAMQLRHMDTGEIIDTYCEMNPQRKFGADVLSRIQASCEGHREALGRCVREVLQRGVCRFAELVEPKAVSCICVAGNTTMEHLFMEYDVSSLGQSPFVPVEIGLQEDVGPFAIPLYMVPGISAFVGGDIVAGLYALEMLPKTEESPAAGMAMAKCRKRVRLLIDLGTNGEMAITDGTKMLVTATAAGPAFEGGAQKEMVGTDMIAVTASLRKKGILDETGLLEEPYFTRGVDVYTQNGDLRLENQDIRALQMAKAAVRAGVEILWEQLGRPRIEAVYLAGGFGYYLDVEAAFTIGLLPRQMRDSVQAVGNTSLEGAFRVGRDLCRHTIDKRMLEEKLSSIRSINLAGQEKFESLYMAYMNLCAN